ncbi:uncharacterized protein BDZ99DRAFT_615 [Mytilinidion resinicola]|uniref:Uncharacterized protein n=1 Tax=Mytilinidion resinicola TaxID=574789 RepID=A0A6A6Z7R8_9PEZI|nr:uncharacterized protein BDZ99DRAFT_615 [Mytilinidion resinicola]KAF2816743.1 hypothetical protein BDZ99DRAFT_615 [Mytilinidion resinicola]
MSPRVAFISGPLDASDEYFAAHYASRILAAAAAGDSFVIGPVRGVDTLALQFLLDPLYDVHPSRITIFMAEFEQARTSWRQEYEEKGVKVWKEGITTRERDAAMTRESDYDILRYRTEEEAKQLYGAAWWPRVSNTEMNERRRREQKGEEVATGYMGPSQKTLNGGDNKRSPNTGLRKKLRGLFGDEAS